MTLDLDINVLFDVTEDEQEERRVQYSGLLKDINGKNVLVQNIL